MHLHLRAPGFCVPGFCVPWSLCQRFRTSTSILGSVCLLKIFKFGYGCCRKFGGHGNDACLFGDQWPWWRVQEVPVHHRVYQATSLVLTNLTVVGGGMSVELEVATALHECLIWFPFVVCSFFCYCYLKGSGNRVPYILTATWTY